MHAGGNLFEGCAISPINLGGSINFGTCLEQALGNFDDVGRRLLPVAFHAIGRNVVEKNCTVQARRAGLDQFRIFR